MNPSPAVVSYQSAAVTTEVLIDGTPCVLYGIIPDATTTGTVTIRDAAATGGSNVVHVAAVGLTQQGKLFGEVGILMMNGLTVQRSVGTDKVGIVYRAI